MSTRDHYNDLPHTLPDVVRDGRQLMQQPDSEPCDEWDGLFGIFSDDDDEHGRRWYKRNLGIQ